jgi:hypothetical protein
MYKTLFGKLISLIVIVIIISTACNAENKANSLIAETDIHKILNYASLAGSSHNTQPWKVEVLPNDSLLVFVDPERLLGVVDPEGLELFISVGAFIENLDIAANALGYSTAVTLHEVALNSGKAVASIKLGKTEAPKNSAVLRELELRNTLRIPFDTTIVQKEHQAKLIGIAPDKVIFLPANSPEGRLVAQKELEAYTIQSLDKDAQDELAAWMRFSNKDVNSKLDGLTPAGMGIKGIGGFMVRNFMTPEDSKKESFIKAGVEKTRTQVDNCGGWILISTDKGNVIEWINAGRIYERMNVMCRSMNLGFHPMNQMIEELQICDEVVEKIAPNRKIVFMARVGYVKEYPAPVSKRRPVESFTTFR